MRTPTDAKSLASMGAATPPLGVDTSVLVTYMSAQEVRSRPERRATKGFILYIACDSPAYRTGQPAALSCCNSRAFFGKKTGHGLSSVAAAILAASENPFFSSPLR